MVNTRKMFPITAGVVAENQPIEEIFLALFREQTIHDLDRRRGTLVMSIGIEIRDDLSLVEEEDVSGGSSPRPASSASGRTQHQNRNCYYQLNHHFVMKTL